MWTKSVISILISMGTVFPAFAANRPQNDNWVPFPWAKELPFSWSAAQGVWTIGSGPDSVTSYFYIRVTQDKNDKSLRFLAITEKDATTCDIIATGYGVEETGKKTTESISGSTRIVAQMTYINSSKSRYQMMLRFYNPRELPENQYMQPVKGKVMVLTISPVNSNKKYNYPMTKVSDRTEYPCNPTK